MDSKLIKNQVQIYKKLIKYDKQDCQITVELRYDDECNNGHNTFSITGNIFRLMVENGITQFVLVVFTKK